MLRSETNGSFRGYSKAAFVEVDRQLWAVLARTEQNSAVVLTCQAPVTDNPGAGVDLPSRWVSFAASKEA